MSESIVIQTAPLKFREYLAGADSVGNRNRTLDTPQEAEVAARMYCHDNPIGCQDILGHLGRAGLSSPRVQDAAVGEAVSSAIYRTEAERTRKDGVFILGQYALHPGTTRKHKAGMVAPLGRVLADKSVDFRKEAAFALWNLSRADLSFQPKSMMVKPFIAALDDSDPYVRERAARSLTNLNLPAHANLSNEQGKNMAPSLIAALYDENPAVAKYARYALWQMVETDISPKIKERINDHLEGRIQFQTPETKAKYLRMLKNRIK